MSWMRSWIQLSQFLSVFLPTFVSSKIYDNLDDFNFVKVNFPFLDGDVPRSTLLPDLLRYFSGVASPLKISRCHNTLFLSSPHL